MSYIQNERICERLNCRIWDDKNSNQIQERPMHSKQITVCCGFLIGGAISAYPFEDN